MHWLANELVRRGHHVTCFSFSPLPADAAYAHVAFACTARTALGRKLEPGRRFAAVDTSGFDVVHYHGDDYWCRGSARRVRTFYGSALFEALHAKRPGRFAYQGLFYILEWISVLRRGKSVAISKATTRALPFVRKVIPCGIPLDRFRPGSAKTPHPSILFLGDLNSRKRGDFLVRIFREDVLGRFPDAELVVVGPQRVCAPGVRYAGTIDEESLVGEYQKAWLHCMPSSYEGFGVPVLEAMACGTAVIATDNYGTREVIHNGVDGRLCPDSRLSDVVLEVLADERLRRDLTRGGLATARSYSIGAASRLYEELYTLSKENSPNDK